MKARKAIPVPLDAQAATLIGKQIGKHRTHVFSFRGKPIRQVSTKAWYAAVRTAGAGWLVFDRVGAAVRAPRSEPLAPYAEWLSAMRAEATVNGTNLSQG